MKWTCQVSQKHQVFKKSKLSRVSPTAASCILCFEVVVLRVVFLIVLVFDCCIIRQSVSQPPATAVRFEAVGPTKPSARCDGTASATGRTSTPLVSRKPLYAYVRPCVIDWDTLSSAVCGVCVHVYIHVCVAFCLYYHVVHLLRHGDRCIIVHAHGMCVCVICTTSMRSIGL